MRANEICLEAKCQFSIRNRDVLINVQSPHKWWSTLKSAVFGSSSSLPTLVIGGGGLVCESVTKTDLLSDQFYSNQSKESDDLPTTCHPPPSVIILALRNLLLDLDSNGGTDPLGMFSRFRKSSADLPPPPSQCSVWVVSLLAGLSTDMHYNYCMKYVYVQLLHTTAR